MMTDKMKTMTFYNFLLAVCCLCANALFLTAQTKEVHYEKNGMVTVEAEDFYKQSLDGVRKWYVISDGFKSDLKGGEKTLHLEGASGNSYIEILPDTRSDHEDELIPGENFSNEPGKMAIVHYKVNFSTPGRYYVWARAYSTGSEDNGVHVGINGTWPSSGQRMQWCEGKDSWRWESSQRTAEVHCGVPGILYLDVPAAGEQDIQFSLREDGFEMDQWIMTTDASFVPDGRMTEVKTPQPLSLWENIIRNTPEAITLMAGDFEVKDKAFYVDNTWLAINPDEHKTAEASKVFEGPSALYDVVFFGVGENDGRSRYSFKVNDYAQGNFRPQLSTNTFEEGPEYAKVFTDIQVNQGDRITVKAEIGSTDGKEYSRGRWSGMALVQVGRGDQLIAGLKKEKASRIKPEITGELKKWHKITLTFDGPESAETAETNPFMDYRLNVLFTHKGSGKSYKVPGYFAADGNAGETSAQKGNKWRIHFAPDEIGDWSYQVDFRKGRFSAVSSKKDTGVSGKFMDGATGTFSVSATDKTGRDFRGKGRLQYVGERYLQFAETGEYFLKQGPDAPENFLSYVDFDGTFHKDGHKDNLIKTWEPHLKDWKEGDPTWQGGKGKAIIGALNYLASKGLNAVSFLTNNIKGDDQNVFPYIDYDTYDRIDISKMDQWEILFEHAQQLGLFLHFKTLEVENQGLLDNGGVGAHSKLYYRELMARFGHHLALNWNLCEENGEWIKNHPTPPQETEQRLAMTRYFKKNDPYHHHLVIHNGIPYDDLLGPKSGLTGPSIQTHKPDFRLIHGEVLHWLEASKEAGFPWAVAVDEPGDAQHSLLPDAENPDHDMARRNALWGTLMAGGWGNEWYFGYKHDHSDLTCQDYRSRDLFWDQAVTAIGFFKDHQIPFWEMENSNELVANPKNENTVYCLAKTNDTYLVYLNSTASADLDLSQAQGNYEIAWFNPKKGGELLRSKTKKATGGTILHLGKAPSKKQTDWVVLVRKLP